MNLVNYPPKGETVERQEKPNQVKKSDYLLIIRLLFISQAATKRYIEATPIYARLLDKKKKEIVNKIPDIDKTIKILP